MVTMTFTLAGALQCALLQSTRFNELNATHPFTALMHVLPGPVALAVQGTLPTAAPASTCPPPFWLSQVILEMACKSSCLA